MADLNGPDDLDEYLAEALQDPGFREAYDKAEAHSAWVTERWWRRAFYNRRVLNRFLYWRCPCHRVERRHAD